MSPTVEEKQWFLLFCLSLSLCRKWCKLAQVDVTLEEEHTSLIQGKACHLMRHATLKLAPNHLENQDTKSNAAKQLICLKKIKLKCFPYPDSPDSQNTQQRIKNSCKGISQPRESTSCYMWTITFTQANVTQIQKTLRLS